MNKMRDFHPGFSRGLLRRHVPEATFKRLVYYARCVRRFQEQGRSTVRSEEIGAKCGVKAVVVRRDFSHFGEFGVRGKGYNVAELDRRLGDLFDRVGNFRSLLVGVGHLGMAITRHARNPYKTRIVAAFDRDPARCNRDGEIPVYPMDDLERIVRRDGILCAVLAIPPDEIQAVVDRLVEAGVRVILSLALIPIQVPSGVTVSFLDILSEVEYLIFRHHLTEEGP